MPSICPLFRSFITLHHHHYIFHFAIHTNKPAHISTTCLPEANRLRLGAPSPTSSLPILQPACSRPTLQLIRQSKQQRRSMRPSTSRRMRRSTLSKRNRLTRMRDARRRRARRESRNEHPYPRAERSIRIRDYHHHQLLLLTRYDSYALRSILLFVSFSTVDGLITSLWKLCFITLIYKVLPMI